MRGLFLLPFQRPALFLAITFVKLHTLCLKAERYFLKLKHSRLRRENSRLRREIFFGPRQNKPD